MNKDSSEFKKVFEYIHPSFVFHIQNSFIGVVPKYSDKCNGDSN